MRVEEQGDHHRILASLTLVNRDDVSETQLPGVVELDPDGPVVDIERQAPAREVHGTEYAHISVANSRLAVVLVEEDAVADAEEPPGELNFRLLRRLGIQCFLQQGVQLVNAQAALAHRRQHLNILQGIDPVARRKTATHHVDQGIAYPLGAVRAGLEITGRLQQMTVGGVPLGVGRSERGRIAFEHPLSIPHDLRSSGLPVDLGEPDDRNLTGFDEVVQHPAGAHAGELVVVADNQHVGGRRNGVEQPVSHFQFHHGSFVDHHQISFQRILAVALPVVFRRIVLDQRMNRGGGVFSDIGEVLRGPAGRRG